MAPVSIAVAEPMKSVAEPMRSMPEAKKSKLDHEAAEEAEYEDYNSTSKLYDNTRVCVGVPKLLETFRSTKTGVKDLKEMRVLDGGCGTGNFLQAIKGSVGHLEGLEFNDGMIEQARKKCPELKITQGSLLEMPFENDQFDAIMINQVIHHLETKETIGRRDNLTKAIGECCRVLKPGGVLVINTSSPDQARDGYWWIALIPTSQREIMKRYVPLDVMQGIMESSGLESVGFQPELDETLQTKKLYLDPEGPTKKEYRANDSSWSLAPEDEIEEAVQKVQKMLAEGTMEQYMMDRDALRQKIGQSTYVSCYKPLAS